MRIRLITFHTPKNYGAVLQGYSLFSYLRNFSNDVKVIDYNTKQLRAKYPLIPRPHSIRGFVKIAINSIHIFEKIEKYKKFDSFVKKYYCLTDRYESYQELEKKCSDADVYFTGSDQVFNPNRIENERKAFYLNFVDAKRGIFSYAASFGIKNIPNEKKDEIRQYLNRYSAISVREASGIDIVNTLTEKQAFQVLDPVFLNDKSFWANLASSYKLSFSNYLFYYRLMGSPESDLLSIKIAQEKNLKLVVMTDDFFRFKADKILRNVGPQEFLYLMKSADYIVTDSFHGVAFSLIFEKQFAFSDFNLVTQERACDLLARVSIPKDIYQYKSKDNIEYCQVNDNLCGLVEESKKYIRMCCEKND